MAFGFLKSKSSFKSITKHTVRDKKGLQGRTPLRFNIFCLRGRNTSTLEECLVIIFMRLGPLNSLLISIKSWAVPVLFGTFRESVPAHLLGTHRKPLKPPVPEETHSTTSLRPSSTGDACRSMLHSFPKLATVASSQAVPTSTTTPIS